MTPAAGALDVSDGSPGHCILRRLCATVILSAEKIIVRQSSLKEERCRTGS